MIDSRVASNLSKARSDSVKSMSRRHLDQAERHVELGEHHIAKLIAFIKRLEGWGRDTTVAREFLATLEATQELHLQHRARLIRNIMDASGDVI
jgi:hypothetical protein